MKASFSILLRNYFGHEHSRVISTVLQSFDEPSHDTFHELRVSLKRIRFIKAILKKHRVVKSIKAFHPYDRLFQQAGRIREYQVHAYLLDKFGVEYHDEAYPHRFQRKERKRIKAWKKEGMKSLQQIISTFPKIQRQLTRWTITVPEYTAELYRQLNKRFGNEVPEEKLHRSRKVLKALLYSSELDSSVRKEITPFANLRIAATLEDAIGDWHDLEMLLKEDPDKKVRNHLEREKNRELKKIRRLIPSLIRKAKQQPLPA